MKRWIRMLALALCLLSVFACTGAALAATKTVTTATGETAQVRDDITLIAAVNGSSVSFRKGPGTNYSRITRLAKGTEVTVLDNVSYAGWWKVRLEDEREGYISAQYLSVQSVEEQETQQKSAATKTSAAKSSAATQTAAKDVNASKIASAKAKNSDTVGWINIPGTNIDDPILYRANFYYATHDINKSKSYEGVYPYYNRLTKNVVIFGHNLRGSNKGFHALHHMQETALGYSRCQSGACGRSLGSTFKNWQNDNRVWNISIFGKTKWEVFAMYEVKANEPKSTLRNNWSSLQGKTKANIQKWLDGQLKRSEIDFGVSVSPDDTFLTLITCGTNYDSATANSRLFVFLKCVG